MPPAASIAVITRPRQPSTVLIAAIAAVEHAGVTDHVGIGEVADDDVVLARRRRCRRARRRRLRRSSPAADRRSPPSATAPARDPRRGTASSRPPLKKYVTCAYFSVSARRMLVRPCAGEHLGEVSGRPAAAETRSGTGMSRRTRSTSSVAPSARRAASKPSKSSNASARMICRARSARKLKKIDRVAVRDRADGLAGSRRRSSPG